MADEEIQKEPPQFQTEPPRPESRLEPRPPDDDNRFRRPSPTRNRMSLTAFCLGALSLLVLVTCLITCLRTPWGLVKPDEQLMRPAGMSYEDQQKDLERQQQDYNRRVALVGTVWMLCSFLDMVLGAAALIFGILGVSDRNRHPTVGGLGYAIFGIVIGIPISLLGIVGICLVTGAVRIPVGF